jgi:hypothetical protein
MSTIRIDKKHAKLLDELVSHLLLRGKKITKKDLIAKLIDEAIKLEGIEGKNNSNSPIEDHAWKGLKDVFELGIEDLSERVDEILYTINGEE